MGFFNSPKVEQQLPVALEGDKPQESLPPPQKVSSTLITQAGTHRAKPEIQGVRIGV